MIQKYLKIGQKKFLTKQWINIQKMKFWDDSGLGIDKTKAVYAALELTEDKGVPKRNHIAQTIIISRWDEIPSPIQIQLLKYIEFGPNDHTGVNECYFTLLDISLPSSIWR